MRHPPSAVQGGNAAHEATTVQKSRRLSRLSEEVGDSPGSTGSRLQADAGRSPADIDSCILRL